MASNQTQDFAKKNEQKSIFQEDIEISKKIFFYAYIGRYQSVRRKNDIYSVGIPAVFAFLLELRNLKNKDVEEQGLVKHSTFMNIKRGKAKPSKELAIKFCIIFKLDSLSSNTFLELLGHSLVPKKIFDGHDIVYNHDYYVVLFLNCYRFLSDDEIVSKKEILPDELGYLFF